MGHTRGKITVRQRKFVEAYVELGNACKAAEKAGFRVAYASSAMRQPAVQEYLAELRKSLPVAHMEVVNFLVGIMRGNIKTSDLRTEAAYQVGKRAGLWKNRSQCEHIIKEASNHE